MQLLQRLFHGDKSRTAVAEYAKYLRAAMSYAHGDSEEQQELYARIDALRVSDVGTLAEYEDHIMELAGQEQDMIEERYRKLEAQTPPEELTRFHTAALDLIRCILAYLNRYNSALEYRLRGDEEGYEHHAHEFGAWVEKKHLAHVEYVLAFQAVITLHPGLVLDLAGVLVPQPKELDLSC